MRVDRLEITGTVAFLVAAAVFATLAWGVSTRTPLVITDVHITQWMVAHRSEPVTAVMLGISLLHSLGAIAAWSVLFGAWLAWMRERYWLVTLVLAVGGGMLLNAALKLLYERARPEIDDPLVVLGTYSFPSGHTAATTVFYGVIAAYLAYKVRTNRQRMGVIAAAVFMVVLVALSRVYLGAHYASDVVAAACSSTVWLMICIVGMHGLVRRRMEGR